MICSVININVRKIDVSHDIWQPVHFRYKSNLAWNWYTARDICKVRAKIFKIYTELSIRQARLKSVFFLDQLKLYQSVDLESISKYRFFQ